MKKKKNVFLYSLIGSVTVLCIVGGAFAYWKGNQPSVTYYPNGGIKTSVQRTFFKENGELLTYRSDGTLSGRYNVVEGVKNGTANVYLDGVSLEINYNNGQWEGPIKIDTHGILADVENANISIDNNKLITITDKSDEGNITVKAKLACEDDVFFDNLQNFIGNRNGETFSAMGGCLDIQEATLGDSDFSCNLNGSFQYPTFKSDTIFSCEDKKNIAAMFMTPMSQGGFGDIEGLGNMKVVLQYTAKDNNFQFKLTDSNGKYLQQQNFKGFDKIIPSIVDFAFSKQESRDLAKLASAFINNFQSGNSKVTVAGRKVFESIGDFNFEKGFSNPWVASFYGLNKNITSQMKISDKGLIMNVVYPISNKPMLSFGIKFDKSFKAKYKSMLDDILKEFTENSEDEAIEHLTTKMPEYAMSFSNVINSVSALLMNNKGEKLIGGIVNVKKGVDINTLMTNPENAFTSKIITYKNNKVDNVITGDLQKGFMVGKKSIDLDEVMSYIDVAALESTMKNIETEFAQAYKLMQKEKYPADPFIVGFYSGYSTAMNKYKSVKILDQISSLADNIKSAYADKDNYNKLNTALARDMGIFSPDMLNEKNIPMNIYGGTILVSSSKAKSGDLDSTAFTLRFDRLPKETCSAIAMTNIENNTNSDIIAIGINTDLVDAFIDQCVTGDGILCTADHNSVEDLQFEVMTGCKEENVLFFKFK